MIRPKDNVTYVMIRPKDNVTITENKMNLLERIKVRQRKTDLLNKAIQYNLDIKKYCKWLDIELARPF
jgi:uncharacterized protein YpmS